VEEKIKPKLHQKNLWLPDHDKTLQQLKQKLAHRKVSTTDNLLNN